jgi:putative hydrolase of the HAD superfamily
MRQREDGLKRYGTTIEWLTCEKGFTAVADYHVYDYPENEADSLPPDPELRRFLENLPCPCSILTNSPGFHADRFIKKLGLEGIFLHVFSLESNDLKGKPHASAFRRALDTLSLKPEEALFVDDAPRYVEGYLNIGGMGILLDELDTYADYPHARIKNLKELARFLGD